MADDNKRWIGARTRRVNLGGRDVIAEGLSDHVWTDFYHRALTASWPVFFAGSLRIFFAVEPAVRRPLPARRPPRQQHADGRFDRSVLLQRRDPRHGRLRRHASADLFRAQRRDGGNLHRHDLDRRHDRADFRALFTAASALSVRPQSRGRAARRIARADDPARQCARQYDLGRQRAAVATGDGVYQRGPAVSALSRATTGAQRESNLCLELDHFSQDRRGQSARQCRCGEPGRAGFVAAADRIGT